MKAAVLISALIISIPVFSDFTLKFDNQTGLPDDKIKIYWALRQDTPTNFTQVLTLKEEPTNVIIEAEIGQEQKQVPIRATTMKKTYKTYTVPITTRQKLPSIQSYRTYLLKLKNNQLIIEERK